MQNTHIEKEIINEMALLLEKVGVEDVLPLSVDPSIDSTLEETMLINIKGINARYDKSDAVVQVRTLMEKYNIQLDELEEHIKV
jgi:hypothetical protein